MANHKDLVMTVSGIRGIIGTALTPELLVDLSAAFAQWLGNDGTVVIGKDSRNTGAAVCQLVSGTMNLCGIHVIDIDLAPTPTVQLMVEQLQVKGGIVVTASHNPIQWNALKLIKSDGTFLSKDEIEDLLSLYEKKQFNYVPYNHIGSLTSDNSAYKMHIDRIFGQIDVPLIRSKKIRVLIDAVGGAGSKITPLMLRELGCEVVEYNTEVTGDFPRGSEPTPENLQLSAAKVLEHQCQIGFCQDPDADRLALIDEKGQAIGEERTLALAVQYKLQSGKGPVVINQSSSRMSEDLASLAGVDFYRAPVGEINVVDKMKEVSAYIGGEGNGGVIDPAIHLGRDSLVGIGYILQLLATSGQSLSQLAAQLPQYVIKKETIPLKEGIVFAVLKQKVIDFYDLQEEKPQTDESDGLRLSFEAKRSWLHFRPSNTEPILRLIAEAPDKTALNALINEVRQVIN